MGDLKDQKYAIAPFFRQNGTQWLAIDMKNLLQQGRYKK